MGRFLAWLVVRAVEICGHHVAVGDLVKFKVVVLEEEGGLETNIKAVKIRDGTESCHIGFLPRHIVYGGEKEQITNKFGQVLRLEDKLRINNT
jgi:hypothetical protein